MNPARTVPWTCRTVRAWRAVIGGSAATDGRAGLFGRHIAGCADCQQYFAGVSALETALRSTARGTNVAPDDELHRRIMRAVADSRPEMLPRRRARRPLVLALGAAAAIAALIALMPLRIRFAPPQSSPAPLATGTPRHPGGALSGSASRAGPTQASRSELSPDAAESLDALAPVAAALAHDPLQSEVDSVYADAQYAVRFLALNFLPADVVADVRTDRTRQRELRGNGG